MLRLAILAACAALVVAERGDIDLDVEETDRRVIIVDDDPSRPASALQESGTVGKQIRTHTAVKVDATEFAKLDVEERIRQAKEKGLTWRDVDLPCDCADEPAPGPGDSPTPSPAAPTPAAPTPAPAPGPPPQTCEQQHNNQACKGQFGKLECHTCKGRIDWVAQHQTHGNVEEAKDRIAMEFLADCGACAKNPVQLGHGYETVFRDDFDGDKLDHTKWKFYTDINFNRELQQYTNREPQNTEVSGGTLKIHAKKERFSGKAGNMRFTAARIDSKEAWTYGRFSFKARMSHTQVKGTWPALWMLPQGDDNWPDSGEIDIMENVGYEGDVIHGTPHTGKYNHLKGSQRGGKIKCKVTDWHVYAVEWTPTRVLWALDGKPYHLFDKESDDNAVWPFTKDFYLIMNFAVGGDWGGVKGVAEQMFEGQGLHMEVDWALVEQQKAGGDVPGPAPPAPTVPTPSAGPAPLPPPSPTPSAGGGETVMVMSYNTEYKDYRNRVRGYGAKIKEVGPAVVGAQECQDKHALARESGLTNVPNTDFQNPIFYDPKKVTLVTSGWMPIKRDKYSKRTVTWAQFKVGQSTFWFFNTHLPHNHGESANTWTHHGIVHHIMEKRKELGAANSPTVIVGDTNPHASHGAKSFEKTLVEDFGFILAYSGRGDKGGLKGYDKIFASKEHFAASNGRDHGTGGSDHPAVTVDLTFK